MSFPDEKTLKKIRKLAETAPGFKVLSKSATTKERFRFQLQQQILKHKIDHKLTGRQLAAALEVSESKVSRIVNNHLEEFSTDRLLDLLLKIKPQCEFLVAA